MKRVVWRFKKSSELIRAVCDEILQVAHSSIRDHHFFSMMLAGGNSPSRIYRELSGRRHHEFPWEKTYFFIGDERLSHSEGAGSNFRMIRKSLLVQNRVPKSHFYPIPYSAISPVKSAAAYELQITNFFQNHKINRPRFDLVLLGFGSDGHTASLFPHSPLLFEKEHLVMPTMHPISQSIRITATLPLINEAQNVIYLVIGKGKLAVFNRLLRLRKRDARYPSSFIHLRSGKAQWFVEKTS